MAEIFVLAKLNVTKDIGSTPTLIYGSDNGCKVTSVLICNQSSSAIFVTVYILREVDSIPFVCDLFKKVKIEGYQTLEFLKDSILNEEAGDTLHAYADFSDNLFNSFVSYSQLTEL